MTNPIQQKTLALLERDYARVHPPGAPITHAATVWLAELAETMARQHAEVEAASGSIPILEQQLKRLSDQNTRLREQNKRPTEERDAARQRSSIEIGARRANIALRQRVAQLEAELAAYPGDDSVQRSIDAHNARNAKRDKLAQRFAAAILTDPKWGGTPERLRELAEGYADAFYPESDR